MLLSAGLEIDSTDSMQMTPLHWSSECGHDEVVRVLLANGAGLKRVTAAGMTALHLAAAGGHLEVARLLTRECCRQRVDLFSLRNNWGLNPIELALQNRNRGAVANVFQTEIGHGEALFRAAEADRMQREKEAQEAAYRKAPDPAIEGRRWSRGLSPRGSSAIYDRRFESQYGGMLREARQRLAAAERLGEDLALEAARPPGPAAFVRASEG